MAQNKRTSFGEDDAPMVKRPQLQQDEAAASSKVVKVEEDDFSSSLPKFTLSKWDLQPWRGGLPTSMVFDDYEFPLATSKSDHILRIYHHASQKHQTVPKCVSSGSCAWCVASGQSNYFKGNPQLKSVPLPLYIETIKTYVIVDADFDVDFHSQTTETVKTWCKEGGLEVLEYNDFFLEGTAEMRYCVQCYPELPAALSAMTAYCHAPIPFKDTMNFSDRRQALADFNAKKATATKEFVARLRDIAILSHFDWVLHVQSSKHTHKKQVTLEQLPDEILDTNKQLSEIKKSISQVELLLKPIKKLYEHICQNVQGETISQLMLDVSECMDSNKDLVRMAKCFNSMKEKVDAIEPGKLQLLSDKLDLVLAQLPPVGGVAAKLVALEGKLDKMIEAAASAPATNPEGGQ